MRSAEFEEKEFEAPLYNQLVRENPRLWPPGQVLESYLGFDQALYIADAYLWELHGFRRPLRGIAPGRFLWPFLPNKRQFLHRLPRFRCNCFIQAKRPEVGSRLTKRLAALGRARPFFRFLIESDQQLTLEAAADSLTGKALFTYAAPVFARSQDLFRHVINGTVIQNTTFPDVVSLAKHHAWYYNRPGAVGILNQGFEPFELPSLESSIERLVREHLDQTEETLSPSDALGELHQGLHEIVRRVGAEGGQPRAAYLTQEWERIALLAKEIEAPSVLFSFLGIEAFAVYFNLMWLTIA